GGLSCPCGFCGEGFAAWRFGRNRNDCGEIVASYQVESCNENVRILQYSVYSYSGGGKSSGGDGYATALRRGVSDC
ncbi:MAG: hypothetical protein FWH36_08275, partial [Lentimicrobiaceae bacterium]|nr:hypothetical protein [Lentimicrobiaceae bacterium]